MANPPSLVEDAFLDLGCVLDLDDVAQILQITPAEVRRLIFRKELKAFELEDEGQQVLKSDLIRFLDRKLA